MVKLDGLTPSLEVQVHQKRAHVGTATDSSCIGDYETACVYEHKQDSISAPNCNYQEHAYLLEKYESSHTNPLDLEHVHAPALHLRLRRPLSL